MAEVKLTLAKSTKGTHNYKTSDDGAIVTSLYLEKEGFDDPEKPPKEITVTIKGKGIK